MKQSRKDILQALVDQIKSFVPELQLVTYKPEFDMFSDIAPSDLPACIIESGSRMVEYNITGCYDPTITVALFIVGPAEMEDDDFYDLDEKVLDAVMNDVNLGDTCLTCNAADADPPRLWPRKTMKTIEQRIRIKYQRDYE